jgi:hypothetical protein
LTPSTTETLKESIMTRATELTSNEQITMKIFALKNTRSGKYVAEIAEKQVSYTSQLQYARMYARRSDASRLANMLNTVACRNVFKIIEIEVTEAAPGKRHGKR